MPSSTSGRLRTAARRVRNTLAGNDPAGSHPNQPIQGQLDPWLAPYFQDRLSSIEAALEGAGPEGFRQFRELDDDLWSLLLTGEYSSFPGIRSYLPDLPEPALQEQWNGISGVGLAAQSVCFYRKLKEVQRRFGKAGLDEATVLDFGCGWGRLTRMLARDVEPGRLFGCDPVQDILDVCRSNRVPATLARSEFLPEQLPFDEQFNLIFSFSVFTHISERTAKASLAAIAASLAPGGLFVMTIRPAAYLDLNPLMEPAIRELGADRERILGGPSYLFVPHSADGHPQAGAEEMDYGEAVITLPWVEQNATGFEVADVSLLSGDMYQVAVTLRRK